MSKYLSPGVYAESKSNTNALIKSIGGSTGGFVGITVRGTLNVPVLVTSWQNFLDTFAYGMETPFIANSDLAYSVYGFFQNGGNRCYIIRTASATAGKAVGKIGEGSSAVPAFATIDEGTWGNAVTVAITANEDNATNFDITVKYNGDVVEKFTNVSNTNTDSNYFVDALGNSKFIMGYETASLSVTGENKDITFTGGSDGITDIQDTDYEASLKYFDTVDDVHLICIPGQVSANMTAKLLKYAEDRGNVFAIIDGAKTADVNAIKAFRKTISCKNGALYYPWIKVFDPLSKTGKLRDCPVCGHVMGVYARTIQERGIWKAPAGTEAVLRGAVDVCTLLVKENCDVLNPLGINAIMPRTNYGIVVWGARSLNPDSSMKYVSDILLNVNIKESIKNGTQWAVFEPNNSALWTRVQTSVESFLDSLWREGGLAGNKASDAYFVKCDEELNPADAINEGNLVCEVGYAPTKPAEFVVFRISHSISNN